MRFEEMWVQATDGRAWQILTFFGYGKGVGIVQFPGGCASKALLTNGIGIHIISLCKLPRRIHLLLLCLQAGFIAQYRNSVADSFHL